MGYQIIKQPNGKLAVFSSIVDQWVAYDEEPDSVIEWFAEMEADRARERVGQLVRMVVREDPRPYYQFTMTYEEADAKSVAHGGASLIDGTGLEGWVASP